VTERGVTESVVEQAALAWLESIGWSVHYGVEIAPEEPGAERDDYGQVVLAQRVRDAVARLNPALPAEAWTTRSARSHAPRARR
jgi:type I restriction enzyme R subunit